MSISSTTHARQIAMNLRDSVCCALHANPGVHSLYNLLNAPIRFRQTAFIVIENENESDTDSQPVARCQV